MNSRSPFLTALLHPLNLMMLGASVLAGVLAAWWLFPVGVVFWVIMVVLVMRDPSLRIDHEMQSRSPLAQRFQSYFDRIERSQVGVFNTLSSASGKMRKALQPVLDEINTLTSEAHTLCERMTTLENYRLVSQSQSDLQADLRQITTMIENTEDPHLKKEYMDSRRSLEERLGKLDAVSTQLDRVEAHLMSLANEMDSVVTEVIRIQATGPEEAAQRAPALAQKLHQEVTELKVFHREAVRV